MIHPVRLAGAATLIAACASTVLGQSTAPAIFVTNNGNLRGSLTSLTVRPDGTVDLVQDFVIGERASGEPTIPGTNAYSASISPNGRFVAVSHATSATIEQVTIVEVAADAHLSIYTTFQTPDSPLDLAWLSDTLLAVTETRSSGTNRVHMYRFNVAGRTFTRIEAEATGGFASWLTTTPDGRWLFVNDAPLSGPRSLKSYRVEDDGTLTYAGINYPTGYGLGMGFDSVHMRLFSCSGSTGPAAVNAYAFDPESGSLTELLTSPAPVPGSSPKQAVASADGSKLLVGYGSDGTMRTFTVDPDTGAVAATGFLFDAGIQGSLGNIATMRLGSIDMVFTTDRETYDGTPRGVCSFVLEADGSLTERSIRVDTGGIAPSDVVVWAGLPTCGTADFDGDTDSGTDADIEAFFNCLAGNCCPTCFALGADFDADGDAGTDADIEAFFRVLGGGNC